MRIFVEVKTESRINLVEKIDDDHYLVYLKEKREKGKANVALLKILKQFFKKNVVIMSGKTSKHKVVVVIDEWILGGIWIDTNKIHVIKSKKEIYLLECLGGLILINIGNTNEYIDLIDEKLKEVNKSWNDIKLILLTNLLTNTIVNLKKIKKICNPELMLSFKDSEILEKKYKISSDMELEEGDIIGACGNLEVIEIQKNKNNHLCYYFHKHKIIVVGEALPKNYLKKYLNKSKLIKNQDEAYLMINKLLNYDFESLYINDGSRFYKKQLIKLIF